MLAKKPNLEMPDAEMLSGIHTITEDLLLGWTPESPENATVVSSWSKCPNDHVCLRLLIDGGGKVIGTMEGTSPSVQGSVRFEYDGLRDAIIQLDRLSEALQELEVPVDLPSNVHRFEASRG